MKLIFVEDYHSSIKELDESIIIALTPMACAYLDKEQIPYCIPEDFSKWEQDDKYIDFFKKWINKFDDFYFKGDKTVHNCLAPIHSSLNNFIKKAIIYKSIFAKLDELKMEIDDFHYFVCKEKTSKRVENLTCTFEGKSIYDCLFKTNWFNEESKSYYDLVDIEEYKRLTPRLRDLPFIRDSLDYIRSYSFLPPWKDKKILFVNYIPNEIRDAKIKGFYVDYLPNFPYFPIKSKKIMGITLSLFKDIEMEYGIPTKVSISILEPILESYLNTFIPQVKKFEEVFTKLFTNKKYDCAVFRHKSLPYHFGAFLASKKIGLKMVYIRHGWDAYYDPITYEIRRNGYDFFVSPTLEFRDYLEEKDKNTYVI